MIPTGCFLITCKYSIIPPPLIKLELLMMKTFLHVGCGPKHKDRTTKGFNTPEWLEQRLDIDEQVKPDIVGTMTDMSAVLDASMDAIFSSHNIEHLYPHEVSVALAEFKRVLNPEGFAVITCPDLQSVCALVAQDKLTEPAYTSPAGPLRHWIFYTGIVRRWLMVIFTWHIVAALPRRCLPGPYRQPVL